MTAPFGVFTPRSRLVWSLGNPDAPDLSFNGVDPYGVEWVIADPAGWYGTPPVDLGLEPRPDHGAWFGRGSYKPRVLEVSGAFRACTTDPYALDAATERLQDVLDVGRSVLLSVTEPIPKQLTVRPSSEVEVLPVRGQKRARRFELVLTAADPFKYAAGARGLVSEPLALTDPGTSPGLPHPVSHPLDHGPVPLAALAGQRTVVNPGNLPAFPVLSIVGPVSFPSLTNMTTGKRMALDLTLGAGQVAVIDCDLRTVRINGVSRLAARAPRSEFWELARGPNDIRFSADSYNPAAAARVTFRPRWK